MFLVGLSASFVPYLMVVLVALVWVGNVNNAELAASPSVVSGIEIAHQVSCQQSIHNAISFHEAQQELVGYDISISQTPLFYSGDACKQRGIYQSVFIASFGGVSQSLRAPPVC